MTQNLNGTSIIGFSRGSANEGTQQGVNPASGEALEPIYATPLSAEFDKALELAKCAFPVYSALSGSKRAEFLNSIADKLDASVDLFAERGPLETGLPEARMRGETARTSGQLRMFANLITEGSWVTARIEHGMPDRQPIPKPDLRSMLRPLGPVAVFCASNFPLAFSVAGGDTAAALAAGCPVVVKAHRSHPGMAELVGNCILEAAVETGMPEGVFSLLYGGQDIGRALVEHPVIQAVGFTGSRAGGTALMRAAAARPQPIPVYAEMSSINPVVMLPGALADGGESLAEGFFGSLTLGVGQFCTNPGLLFLPEDGADAFLAKLSELVGAAAGASMLNAGTCQAYGERLEALGAISGVEALAAAPKTNGKGAPAVFTVSLKRFLEEPGLQEECFGPATLIVRAPVGELAAAFESLEGQLTGTVFGTPEELAAQADLVANLQAKVGRLIFNGFPTGVEVCHSMVHGGPYPATSDGRSTSVGTLAIERFCRHVAWQGFPEEGLPEALKEGNPLGIWRMVDGSQSQ
ncbi:aldehyde dehydrogenase (NADP(+)) [Haloferula sp.]|uniref:aldehyde dehydrogenase (NADP(+)) n=1 Tax=Haloferula sp. TaxID=2497595 RepID=UPI00329ABAE0